MLIFHVAISLIGILTGFIVLYGLWGNHRLDSTNAIFLATTITTSITGYLLPADHLMPSHIVGGLSLLALALACFARYPKNLAGSWNRTYIITAMIAQYFNVFVLVAQSFMKLPPLHALAPTGSEPPFAIAQLLVLVGFILATTRALKAQSPLAIPGRLAQTS